MQYAFGRSDDRIEMEDFDQQFHDASIKGSAMGVLTKQFPWILPLMQSMPDWLLVRIDPNMNSFVKLEKVCCHSLVFQYFYISPWFSLCVVPEHPEPGPCHHIRV